MKTIRFYLFFIPLIFILSCKEEKKDIVVSDFSGALTEQEAENGIVTPEILWKFGRVSDARISPNGEKVVYSVSRYDYKTNKSKADLYVTDIETGSSDLITNFEGPHFNQRWHPDGEKIAYITTENGTAQMWEVKPDGTARKQTSNVEGGINSFEYSPTGTHIYYTQKVKLDKTPQEQHPDLPLIDVRIETDLMYRHWNRWNDYSYSHIFVAPYENGTLGDGIDIMEGEKYESPLAPYYSGSEITWSPDGKMIAYTSKKMNKRDYATSTNSDIYLYKIDSGETINLTEGMLGYDKYPSFSPDSKKLIWQSMETPGYEADKERIFMLDLETNEKTYLTKDWDQNASNFGWMDDQNIYFISGINATYQIYRMNLSSREITQITTGMHNYTSVDYAGGKLIGEKMSMAMATEIFQINIETGIESQLSFVNQHIYDHIEMARVEERWITTTDGKNMLVWLIYPPNFDPLKKYPALLYCGGGPQSAVSQFFSYRWNFQIMAANDYVIIAPNRRGLPTFGQEWNAQISGDWGGQATTDLLTALDVLKTESFIDENRLGAVGASYGGFSVFHLAGVHQKRFKTFIAHNGTFNLESMYAATEETFFVNHDFDGPFWESPTPVTYNRFSPHRLVQNWDTPIMVVTGEHDYRVPYTEGLQAFNSARLRGIPAKLLHFPGETHFVLKPQNAILWQREFFSWLDLWLKD
jgi:dipeptidyl aminopeptidase/acylaminoacyl peptidase